MNPIFASCLVLTGLGGLAALVVGYLAIAKGLEDVAHRALAAAAVATLPGLVFVGHLVAKTVVVPRDALRPYDLVPLLPAFLLGVLGSPWGFFVSATSVRPGRLSLSFEALRVLLLLGWLASSVLVCEAATEV